MRTKPFVQRKGFTLVELLIAVAVISVLATLVVINVTQSRRTARDGNRRTDVTVLLSAIQQYGTAKSDTFITYNDQTCTVPSDKDTAASGAGCVGANGRSYGMVNAAGTQRKGLSTSGSLAVKAYPAQSIVSALRDGGYLNQEPRDPLAGQNISDPGRDYALIRACSNGGQQLAPGGDLFAVWARLEGSVSQADFRSFERVPGSYYLTNPSGSGLVYDFAAENVDLTSFNTVNPRSNTETAWYGYTLKGFAAGNNSVARDAIASGSCSTGAGS